MSLNNVENKKKVLNEDQKDKFLMDLNFYTI